MDVLATVQGGGITGQAGAVSQGVARALKVMFGITAAPETPETADTDGEASAVPVGDSGL